MPDIIDTHQRSNLMSRIRSRDTAPEIAVRRTAHAIGLRFRLHRRDLPGSPDLVFPRRRLAIFVHGCFWHQHEGCKRSSHPKSRQEYWIPKLEKNKNRDKVALELLTALGWRTAIIWECETSDRQSLSARLLLLAGVTDHQMSGRAPATAANTGGGTALPTTR